MKSRLIVSSLLIIVLCLSLIAGSTFALFTSESKLGVAVSSAKVNVAAELVDDSIVKDFGDPTATDAKIDTKDPAKINITNFAPKDKITVALKLTNESTIAIKYRLAVLSSNDFGGALKVSATPVKVDTWYSAKAGQTLGDEGTVYVTIEYQFTEGGALSPESSDLTFVVEAVQANGVEAKIKTVDDFKNILEKNHATDAHPITAILQNDLVISEPLSIKGKIILDTNGKNITTANEGEASNVKYPFVMTDSSALTIKAKDSTINTGYQGLVEIPQNVSANLTIEDGSFVAQNLEGAEEKGAFVKIASGSTKSGNKIDVKMIAVTLNAKGVMAFNSTGMTNTSAELYVERSTFVTDTVGLLVNGCKLKIEDTKFETNETAIELVGTRFASAERCEIIINTRAVGDNIAGVSVANNAKIYLTNLSITAPKGIPAYMVCDTNGQIIVSKSTANTDTVTKIEHESGSVVIDGTTLAKK